MLVIIIVLFVLMVVASGGGTKLWAWLAGTDKDDKK